jgi:hypothetical protein
MAPTRTGQSKDRQRGSWEPPAVTKVAISAETKSPVSNEPGLAEPQPPVAPATKLGFSFEMAFPLAARSKK